MSALTPGPAANPPVAGNRLAIPSVETIGRLSRKDLVRLGSLLEQRPAREPAPIRTVHHFACTGGTLIARGLQSQPNTLLLSEMDPLSPIQLKTQRSRFAPTDPILLARSALSPINDETAVEMFIAAMKVLHSRMDQIGRRLVLRDHAHSQFCTETDWRRRPSLAEMLARVAPLRSIVTVRHPIDSFLALDRNQWFHFSPPTLDEYARRYLAFLSVYEGVPLVRYESFVSDPDETMRGICKQLDLPYNSDWKALISVVKLSGDSGRRGDKIAPRIRREYSEELVRETQMSEPYQELCAKLGYDAQLAPTGS